MDLFSHSWLPFIYLYGLGGLLFVFGIIITLKAGSFDLSRYSHKKWMWVLLFGFVWYLMIHALMTWAALGIISVYTVPIVLLGMAAVFIAVTLMLKRAKKGEQETQNSSEVFYKSLEFVSYISIPLVLFLPNMSTNLSGGGLYLVIVTINILVAAFFNAKANPFKK
jgi:hypothetical protein